MPHPQLASNDGSAHRDRTAWIYSILAGVWTLAVVRCTFWPGPQVASHLATFERFEGSVLCWDDAEFLIVQDCMHLVGEVVRRKELPLVADSHAFRFCFPV